MTKVVVVDSLTETFNGPIVRSGLQKSAKLDARAFAKMGYDTTFIYCGDLVDDDYSYKKVCVNHIGAKEDLARDGKHPRATGGYVKKYLQSVVNELMSADYIIGHCHSLGVMTGLNTLVTNKKILCIVHDVIDLMWAYGASNSVVATRNTNNNSMYLATNSQYSIDRLNYIYERAKDKVYTRHKLLSGDEMFDGYISHFVWTDETPTEEEILHVEPKSAVIGRYEMHKFHHKLYSYKNPNNLMVHYGIQDPRRDEGLCYYNNMKTKANSYAENLTDEELWRCIKSSQSIILPCWHEGFGYTAFEAGIFGVVPVVFAKKQSYAKSEYQHATAEYLTRAGVSHFVADFNDDTSIQRAIDASINVTPKERLEVSRRLLEYFTVEKYVEERINLMDSVNDKQNVNSLESFFA